jgi:beta-phosphoglucomutase-like phosphatase (HAD superfamily)
MIDLATVTTLLCDADGTLFPSEEPAYDASATVTQAFAQHFGLTGDFSAAHLRHTGTGRNFRSLTADLLRESGLDVPEEERGPWIDRERVAVTDHLAGTLRPDPEVINATSRLLSRYCLAVVSSSATSRLLACLRSTGLDQTFGASNVFSAEDSMPRPVSKPDPAIYRHAMATLRVTPALCLAIEDSATGAESAIAAGITTIGLVAFVPANERAQRVQELSDAGASLVLSSWAALDAVLAPDPGASI